MQRGYPAFIFNSPILTLFGGKIGPDRGDDILFSDYWKLNLDQLYQYLVYLNSNVAMTTESKYFVKYK